MTYIRKEIIGDCEIWNGDIKDILPLCADRVGAICADPPYGIAYSRGAGGGGFGGKNRVTSPLDGRKVIGDDKPFDPSLLLSLDVPTILWGANHYASRLPDSSRWLVWDKRRGTATNDFADCEFAWTNLSGPARCLPHMWNGGLRDSERGVPRVHQTQKAIVVMEWCLGFIPEGLTILDGYLGSGTTLVACAKMGRKGIGIELDPDYFEIACNRVREAYAQPDLFVEPPKQSPVQEGFDV